MLQLCYKVGVEVVRAIAITCILKTSLPLLRRTETITLNPVPPRDLDDIGQGLGV